jgi:DNA-binding transcriptional regulator YdaS (Cro superfamily)
MATATTGYTWVSGNTVLPGLLNQMVNSATITLSNDEVTTAKIADANVTNAKLASDIDASKLTTGTLPIARIADGAVSAAKLAAKVTFPNYAAGVTQDYNLLYQAATDGYLLIVVSGSFRNYAQMVVGTTNSPATVVWQNGDDINSNTKWASALLPVPKDIYYKVQPGTFPGAPEGFESVVLTWYPAIT